MSNFRGHIPTSGATPRPQFISAGMRPPPTSATIESVPVDTLISVLQRLEAKLDASDQKMATPCYSRPDPDPPYGMPPGWQEKSWTPEGVTTPAVMMTTVSGPPPSSSGNYWPFSDNSSLEVVRPPVGNRSRFPQPRTRTAWDRTPPRTTDSRPHQSAWEPPTSRGPPSYSTTDPARHIRMDPPLFDGSDAQSWVTRIDYYFDHIMLPEDDRLHFVVMLFVPPASDWVFSYRANNPCATWPKFLEDVRRRFDPHYYVNYMELLSKLTQTGALGDYNREFERMLNQIQGVSESVLLPIYMGGLRQPIRNQVRFQHPTSIAAAMSLACEIDSTSDRNSAFGR